MKITTKSIFGMISLIFVAIIILGMIFNFDPTNLMDFITGTIVAIGTWGLEKIYDLISGIINFILRIT